MSIISVSTTKQRYRLTHMIERVGKVKVVLIQTHKDYDCGGAHD
jgi:hypothetical protein